MILAVTNQKGGVGKTTVAASLAVLAASRGKRVLVVSTDPAHSLGDVFDRQLGDTPRRFSRLLYLKIHHSPNKVNR